MSLLSTHSYLFTPFFQVCVNYKDHDYLKDECQDGRRLGFTGKVCRDFFAKDALHGLQQAIHPAQVSTIQSTFVPTSAGIDKFLASSHCALILDLLEILRAAKIVYGMEQAHRSQKGAIGLDGEMIDAPMIKQVWFTIKEARRLKLNSLVQAERIIHIAQAAGLEIPLIAS